MLRFTFSVVCFYYFLSQSCLVLHLLRGARHLSHSGLESFLSDNARFQQTYVTYRSIYLQERANVHVFMIKLLNIVYILQKNIKDSGFRQKLQCTAKSRMIYEGIAVSCVTPTGSVARKLKKTENA